MSLADTTPPRQFAYAIFAAKNLDDPSYLEDQIGANLPSMSHIYTNGANDLVIAFARENGVPCTIYPLHCSNLLKSTGLILAKVEAAYIVADSDSKSAAQIREMCDKHGTPYKLLTFEPVAHWKGKVCKVAEIMACMEKADISASAWATAVNKIV